MTEPLSTSGEVPKIKLGLQEKYKEEDNNIKLRIDSKNDLEGILYQTKTMLTNEDIKSKMSEENLKIIELKCSEIEEWLSNDNNSCEIQEYHNKKEELENILKEIHENDTDNTLNDPDTLNDPHNKDKNIDKNIDKESDSDKESVSDKDSDKDSDSDINTLEEID